MKFLLSILIPLLLPLPPCGNSANILFYSNIASYSHRVVIYPLALELARRGHQVTMINPFRPRDDIERHPNLTDLTPLSVEQTITDWLDGDFDISLRVKKEIPRMVFACFPTALKACEELLTSPELKDYFNKTNSLDLVFLDSCQAECGAAIAYKYGAKHVFYNTLQYDPSEHDFYGMHAPQSGAIPETDIEPVRVPMTFFDRVYNTLISLHFRYEHYKYMTKLDEIVRRNLNLTDDEMPFLDDLARNHSLIFYPAEVITDYPRSHPPNAVSIAGIHCKNTSGSLSKEATDFINNDDNSDGFVYISLGSYVVPSMLPEHIKDAMFSTIASFPKLNFLWKWKGDRPQNAPENVFFSKWFPQQEILGHPSIKGFVTQSGRPSTLEAVCHGVPMIAFPVLSDQDVIANRMEMVGSAIKLELGTVTKDEFTQAINKVVYEGRIAMRAKELQRIFRDKPQTPMESAVWWTEYVLRHDDMSHLRPAGFEQSWYQRRLLDVYASLFALILIVFVIVSVTVFGIVKLIRKFATAINNHDQIKSKNE